MGRMKIVVMFIIGIMVAAEAAEAEAATDDGGCIDMVVSNMISCVPFMKAEGSPPAPDKACCDGLGVVVKTDPNCICMAVAAAPSFGITVNMTRATTLPPLCHVVDPLSLCHAPVTAPSLAPKPHHATIMVAPAPAPTGGSSRVISSSCVLLMTFVAAIAI